MAEPITDRANDLADGVADAGRKTAASARNAGETAASKVESASVKGASSIRRGGRSGSAAYDDVSAEIDERVSSLEDTIRQNPLAAAGAALVVGIFLGRFVL
jgi:ElaB/YqjD/DUF883 family membrane-anchored ribosome-binding protein